MRKYLDYFLLVMVAIIVGLAFGFSYGYSNQNTYLIDGLRLLDPHFLEHDWFATQTTHYHHQFGYIVYFLHRFGSGAWNLAFLNLFLIVIGVLFIWKWSFSISQKQIWPVFLLLASIVISLKTFHVAHTYVFSYLLQPSSISAIALLGAISFFITGQFFISGLLLGFSGFCHANFLILGFPFFFCSHILIKEKNMVRRLFEQLGPSTVILVTIIPIITQTSLSEQSDLARYIFQHIGAPNHYVPRTFIKDFIPYFGWHIIAIACIKLLQSGTALRKRLYAIYCSFVTLVIVATTLTTVIFIPMVSQLFFWRMAPFSVLLAQSIIIITLIQYFDGTISKSSFNIFSWRQYAISVGLAMILWKFYPFVPVKAVLGDMLGRLSCLLVLGVLLPILIISFHRWYLSKPRVFGATSIMSVTFSIFIIVALINVRPAYKNSTLLIDYPPKEQKELYLWAKTTPPESLFVVPIKLQNFRLYAGRSIVVDWKSRPVVADETIEWYRRIGIICGDVRVKNQSEAIKKYNDMDKQRIDNIIKEFDADYVVFRKNKFKAEYFKEYPMVFSNSGLVVIAHKSKCCETD